MDYRKKRFYRKQGSKHRLNSFRSFIMLRCNRSFSFEYDGNCSMDIIFHISAYLNLLDLLLYNKKKIVKALTNRSLSGIIPV